MKANVKQFEVEEDEVAFGATSTTEDVLSGMNLRGKRIGHRSFGWNRR